MAEDSEQGGIDIVEKGVRPSVARRVIGGVALVLLVLALWLTTDREAVAAWKSEAGPVPFFLALAVLPAFGFPTTPFFVLAGALYGVWVGLIGSAAAVSVNLVLCYWVANSKLRPWLERRLQRSKYKLPNLSGSRASAFRFAMLVKIAPGLPTFAKNYVVGMTGVPFWIYFLVSFVFTGIYAASFIVLGESIFDRDFGTAGIAVGVLVVCGGALLWFRLKRRRTLQNKNHAI